MSTDSGRGKILRLRRPGRTSGLEPLNVCKGFVTTRRRSPNLVSGRPNLTREDNAKDASHKGNQ